MKRIASSPQNWILLTAYCLLITVLSACQTVETFLPTPTPTATATPTLTPTPTIVWFPPTNTPTPPPTVEIPPTPDQLAGLGDLLYADDFSTGDGWPLLTSARGNVALSQNSLTLAVFDARASISSVLQGGVFSNFYMEITAKTSLCSGEDQYGVLFRAASNADFYRFALTCDGQARLDRVVGGTASSPQDWMFSSVIPVGPSGTVRLGVWVLGREMRFFINDEFHFTVSDPMIPSGGIGVYARAAGDTALTVNFLDLEVYAVSP